MNIALIVLVVAALIGWTAYLWKGAAEERRSHIRKMKQLERDERGAP